MQPHSAAASRESAFSAAAKSGAAGLSMVARHSRRWPGRPCGTFLGGRRSSRLPLVARESKDAFASHQVRAKIAEPAVYWTVASQTSPFDPAFTTAS